MKLLKKQKFQKKTNQNIINQSEGWILYRFYFVRLGTSSITQLDIISSQIKPFWISNTNTYVGDSILNS